MMRIKALTLSDGSEVCVSQDQINILGSNESEAAVRIERARMVRSAVMLWAEQQCELGTTPARAKSFYRSATAQQRGRSANWLLGYKNKHVDSRLTDPDLKVIRAWALNDTTD